MVSKNKTLEAVCGIEEALATDCSKMNLADEADRAKMAWWIFNNFGEGDLMGKIIRREKKPLTIHGLEKTS